MKTMIMLSKAERSAVLILIFLVLTFQILVLCYGLFSKKICEKLYRDVLLVSVSLGLLLFLAEGTERCSLGQPLQGMTKIAMAIPAAVIVVAMLGIFCCMARSFWKELEYQKHTITRSSVRESADTLPMGLCFAKGNGQTYLVNEKMEQLSYELCGESLQNAEKFWQMIAEGRTEKDVQRSQILDVPAVVLKDGTAWVFDRRIFQKNDREIVQLTATDTTELYHLACRLRQENITLCDMNERLEEYRKRVEELTRIQERLAMKMRIHDSIGQNLLITRHLLLQQPGEKDKIQAEDQMETVLKKWHLTIAMLRREAEPAPLESAIKCLEDAAKSAGVHLVVNGSLPEQEDIEELVVLAGAEVLTNAVRHAGAREIQITVTETWSEYNVVYTNDGKKPEKPVEEGGGLSGLRKQIEATGGRMDICTEPEFRLKIAIPKERQAQYD